MKAFGNIAAILSAISLMAILMVAQRDYQRGFSGSAVPVATDDVGSVAAQAPAANVIG